MYVPNLHGIKFIFMWFEMNPQSRTQVILAAVLVERTQQPPMLTSYFPQIQ
jgi:hypothetical protein